MTVWHLAISGGSKALLPRMAWSKRLSYALVAWVLATKRLVTRWLSPPARPRQPQFQPPPPSPRQPPDLLLLPLPVPGPLQTRRTIKGLPASSIPRELGDGALAMAVDAGPRPGVDAMKEARSFDPYEASEGHWDHGLLLSNYLKLARLH